jgi:hypothetical protein
MDIRFERGLTARRLRLVLVGLFLVVASVPAQAQRGGRGGPPPAAEQSAPIDLTGYWVSVVTEDWKLRMVVPNPGVVDGIPVNGQARQMANAWTRDVVPPDACIAYGAPAIMRLPGRFHITWDDPSTLRIDADYGMQTRLLHFTPTDTGAPSRQGYSAAEWQSAPGGGGGLRVVTDNLIEGWIRKNGVPISDQAVMTEFFDRHTMPNGDEWLTITSRVEDPMYFSGPMIFTTDFKRLPNDEGWNPTPCSVD